MPDYDPNIVGVTVGPQGPQGIQGEQGPQGIQGPEGIAADISSKLDKGTYNGTASDIVASQQAANNGEQPFQSLAEANTFYSENPPIEDVLFVISSTNGVDAGHWKRIAAGNINQFERKFPSIGEFTKEVIGKNIADKNKIISGQVYSPSSQALSNNPLWRVLGPTPVVGGQTYTLSGIDPGVTGIGGFPNSTDTTGGITIPAINGTFTIPLVGITHIVANITNANVDTYNDTILLELGPIATTYEAFTITTVVKNSSFETPALKRDYLIEDISHNLINPSDINYLERYSTGTGLFTGDILGIAFSGYIKVQEGCFYAVSGEAIFSNENGFQGGYFANFGDTTSLQNIIFSPPPTGSGQVFQVPTGLGIQYVGLNLRKLNDSPLATSLQGVAKLEKGEVATAYQPFLLRPLVKEELLPTTQAVGISATLNAESWYQFTEGGQKTNILTEKAPIFRNLWNTKNIKDIVVLGTGTSLTSRTIHCTDHLNATSRPPLMHSNNMPSLLWDKMSRGWYQQYRRYDFPDFFTETGSFQTAYNVAEWDDSIAREGFTRYSASTGASVSFDVPVGAWQFNFILRTDSIGVSDNIITLTQGNDFMEAYDEIDDTWKEANNFVFSMRESTPVLSDINVPLASTGEMVSRNITTKSNTHYQKRLKMRCKSGLIDSRNSIKNVSITAQTSGRFMFWGVEWSERQYMITYINSARGGWNSDATTTVGLPRVADNEVHRYKPDLLLFELPIHNDGAAAGGGQLTGQFERLTDHYVFRSDYDLSIKTRSQFFGYNPEIIMFTSTIAVNFGGINEDGTLKLVEQSDGKMVTALDEFNEAYDWVLRIHPEVGIVNCAQRWFDAANAIFNGNIRNATIASGQSGITFTSDGGHPNDRGSKVLANPLLSIFDNL
ncbi:hypothetical protein [Dokdonia sp.]|uniref:hypothetical protein n=1 Tax=Dokdonia sp. TaxID=2024995 RepID=UPI0032634DE3